MKTFFYTCNTLVSTCIFAVKLFIIYTFAKSVRAGRVNRLLLMDDTFVEMIIRRVIRLNWNQAYISSCVHVFV